MKMMVAARTHPGRCPGRLRVLPFSCNLLRKGDRNLAGARVALELPLRTPTTTPREEEPGYDGAQARFAAFLNVNIEVEI